ncbi:MAG: hypothetical protein AB202_00540 [Parcubacteria bacterium C7867-007]|nr:MAG: hypothetical protein AB202_00540 [Parcubacteria bacterium C7867-007]
MPAAQNAAGEAEAQDHHRPGRRLGNRHAARRRDDDRRIQVVLETREDLHVVQQQSFPLEARARHEAGRVRGEGRTNVDLGDGVETGRRENERLIAPIVETRQTAVEDDVAVVVDDLEVQVDRERRQHGVHVLPEVGRECVEVAPVGHRYAGVSRRERRREAGAPRSPTVAGNHRAADAAGGADVGDVDPAGAGVGRVGREGGLRREVGPNERLDRCAQAHEDCAMRGSGKGQSKCAGHPEIQKMFHFIPQ